MSAYRPKDNLYSSAVFADAPPHRPKRKQFPPRDHLEASECLRPRSKDYEYDDHRHYQKQLLQSHPLSARAAAANGEARADPHDPPSHAQTAAPSSPAASTWAQQQSQTLRSAHRPKDAWSFSGRPHTAHAGIPPSAHRRNGDGRRGRGVRHGAWERGEEEEDEEEDEEGLYGDSNSGVSHASSLRRLPRILSFKGTHVLADESSDGLDDAILSPRGPSSARPARLNSRSASSDPLQRQPTAATAVPGGATMRGRHRPRDCLTLSGVVVAPDAKTTREDEEAELVERFRRHNLGLGGVQGDWDSSFYSEGRGVGRGDVDASHTSEDTIHGEELVGRGEPRTRSSRSSRSSRSGGDEASPVSVRRECDKRAGAGVHTPAQQMQGAHAGYRRRQERVAMTAPPLRRRAGSQYRPPDNLGVGGGAGGRFFDLMPH